MSQSQPAIFAERGQVDDIESGTVFAPAFDRDGLIPAIVTERSTGTVVMFAYMNSDALRLTLDTGIAHFWSRSRNRLWKKGEDSGNLLQVLETRTDCDQDVILLDVSIQGDGVACHTGAKSCFYRKITAATDGALAFKLARGG